MPCSLSLPSITGPIGVAGIDELCRVAPLRVVLTYDPLRHTEQWMIRDYVPEVAELEVGRPRFDEVCERLEAT